MSIAKRLVCTSGDHIGITSERSEGVIPSSLRMYFRTKKFVEACFSILLSEEMEVAKLRYKCITSIAFWDQQTCRQAG